ncbi:MAG: hypothetical protein ACXADU_06020 [Promethearchaeota archaeon]|jgi:hypothetical protein
MNEIKFESVIKEFVLEAVKTIKKKIAEEPNKSKALNQILGYKTLDDILNDLNLEYSPRLKIQPMRCLEIIAYCLINNPEDYKTLVNQLRQKTHLSENRVYINIRTYLPTLSKVTPEINISKWLPQYYRQPYEYEDILELVKNVSVDKSGIEGTLVTTREEHNRAKYGRNPAHTHVLVKCNVEDHKPWKITPNNLSMGKWCRECYIENIKLTYEDIAELAKRIGLLKIGIPGTLLTTEEEFNSLTKNTKPSKTKLKFSCNVKGHIPWETVPNVIKDIKWCPQCGEKGRYQEEITRWFFRKIFKRKFPTTPLRLLILNYKGNMHFDGYSKILINGEVIKLAFEYNGRQHYDFPNAYDSTYQKFLKRQERDLKKIELCKENDIILIIIPHTVKPEDRQEYIIERFETLTGIELGKLPKFDYKKRFQQTTTLCNYL